MDSFTKNNSGHPSGLTNSSGQFPLGTRPNSLDNNVQNQTPLPIGSVHRLHFHSYVDVPILANPSAADLGRMLLSGHHGPVNTVVTHEVVRPHEEEAMRSHQGLNASSSSHPPPRPSNSDLHHGPTHFHLPPPPGFDKPNPDWAPHLNHHHHHPSQVPYYSTNASTIVSTSRDGASTSTAPLDVPPLRAVNTSVPETEPRDYMWVSDDDDIPEGIPLVTAIPVPYGNLASPPAPAAAPAEPQQDLGAGGSRDGRIRSLPRLREGDPFRCPLCMEPFALSQLYANHVRVVHLKNESKEEKEARRARRCNARTGRRGRRRRVHADNAPPRAAAAVVEDAGGSGVAPVEVYRPPHSLFTGESLRHARRIARQVQAPAAPAEPEVAEAEGGGGRRDKGKRMVGWA